MLIHYFSAKWAKADWSTLMILEKELGASLHSALIMRPVLRNAVNVHTLPIQEIRPFCRSFLPHGIQPLSASTTEMHTRWPSTNNREDREQGRALRPRAFCPFLLLSYFFVAGYIYICNKNGCLLVLPMETPVHPPLSLVLSSLSFSLSRQGSTRKKRITGWN